MYTKEVLHAIYENHHYEYFIINRDFEVVAYSEKVSRYCVPNTFNLCSTDLFSAIPEFFGIENELMEVFTGQRQRIVIPFVFKEPADYVNISIQAGEKEESGTASKTLIILFEDVTVAANVQHSALQDLNENALLLEKIADKNAQLKILNQEMERLVEEEVLKNMEKQRTIEIQSRHSQMGEMIGMITHQWKQPISVIHTICGLLLIKYERGSLDKDTFAEKIGNILKQSRHMNQTIYDFQHFFNPSKKKVSFNLMDTITSVLSLVGLGYSLDNIDIILEGDKDICVYGHSNEYSQVVLSLLQNAKDAFLAQPHKDMKIHIVISPREEKSLVMIRDNAGGIPVNVIGQIFNLYSTTKEEGSGLGLHIARNVIENNMGGKLTVKNVEHGAEFSITI